MTEPCWFIILSLPLLLSLFVFLLSEPYWLVRVRGPVLSIHPTPRTHIHIYMYIYIFICIYIYMCIYICAWRYSWVKLIEPLLSPPSLLSTSHTAFSLLISSSHSLFHYLFLTLSSTFSPQLTRSNSHTSSSRRILCPPGLHLFSYQLFLRIKPQPTRLSNILPVHLSAFPRTFLAPLLVLNATTKTIHCQSVILTPTPSPSRPLFHSPLSNLTAHTWSSRSTRRRPQGF